MNVIVIGAGIAGLSAAYKLKKQGIDCTILEERSTYGGLLDALNYNGFHFDRAVHVSFADQKEVRAVFDKTPYLTHTSTPKNWDRQYWLTHPVQNNLFPLPEVEKKELIKSFSERPDHEIENYGQWLDYQYGQLIAERYPKKYTRKYWTVEADALGTDWIGRRMSRPTLEQILKGAESQDTEHVYYLKELRYPQKGGYKAFLDPVIAEANVLYEQKVVNIDLEKKQVTTARGDTFSFDVLVNTSPLPVFVQQLSNVPQPVTDCAQKLWATQVDLVSIGFSKPDIIKELWFYIYDEDIWASRAYSPSVKSPANCPPQTSSLQFEIYSSHAKPQSNSVEALKENCIYGLEKMGLATRDEIALIEHDRIDFGNVVFYNGMEQDRAKVLDWLDDKPVFSAGRFGEWDYFWSHQSMESGFKAANAIITEVSQ